MQVSIFGYATTTTSIDEETWEEMSDSEKRGWAMDQLRSNATVNDVSNVMEDGEEIAGW